MPTARGIKETKTRCFYFFTLLLSTLGDNPQTCHEKTFLCFDEVVKSPVHFILKEKEVRKEFLLSLSLGRLPGDPGGPLPASSPVPLRSGWIRKRGFLSPGGDPHWLP